MGWRFESAGLTVSEARSRYLARIRPNLEAMARSLLAADVTVEFAPGSPGGNELSTILVERRAVDRARWSTTAGPHRGDLQNRVGRRVAKGTVSRGQQELLATALILGELELHQNEQATLLLVDSASDLNGDCLGISTIAAGAQIVMAPLQPNLDALWAARTDAFAWNRERSLGCIHCHLCHQPMA